MGWAGSRGHLGTGQLRAQGKGLSLLGGLSVAHRGYGREPEELQGAQAQLPSAGAPAREIKAEPEQHSSTSILRAGRVAMVGRDTDGTHRLLWGHLGVLLPVFVSTAKS